MTLVVALVLIIIFFDFIKEEQNLLIPDNELITNQIEQIQIIDKSNNLKRDLVYEYSELKNFEKIIQLLRNITKEESTNLDNEKNVIYELYITNKGYSSNPPILIHVDSISFRGNTTYVSSEKINIIINELKTLIQK
jgi:hypothetical protein